MSGQRTLSLEMREFYPTDYPRLLEIYNANYPDYARSVGEWRSRDESVDRSKYYLQRYAFLDNNATVGFGEIAHVTDMFHPHKFWISIYVDLKSQGRGVGSSIHDRLNEELRKLNAVAAWAGSREDLPRLTEFYQKRGFAERMKAWESRLDINTADTAKFQNYLEKAIRQGITFTNLAAERRNDQESLRKLHELVQLISVDMPSPAPFTPISFEQWKAFELKNPSLLPDGYMIAKDGDRYVGLSTVWRLDQEPRGLVQGNTGVRREYRGKGIAVALKLKVIDFAKQNGYERVKTWNASNNAPMLAVNTKLGFKRGVGWITLEKDLERSEHLPFLEKFTGRAAAYSAGRPSYPSGILDILTKEISFDHTKIVADIGSGTGILSKLFLENGNRVYGVEPNKEMREIAERTLAGHSSFVSVNATAENTTIREASIDLVTVGQALHWFDSELASTEFARILKLTGYLCALYNDRNKDSEFMKAYDHIIQKYARDRAKVPDINHEYLSKFYNEGKYLKFLLPNNQTLDLEGLFGRMTSASYMPHPGDTEVFSELRRDIEELFRSHDNRGRVKLAYETSVFQGQVRR